MLVNLTHKCARALGCDKICFLTKLDLAKTSTVQNMTLHQKNSLPTFKKY